jgi:septal ring factor EnvC (AmiA/AmiB activator)
MKKQTLLMIGFATLLASATQASQEQLAKSIQEAHHETDRTSEQLKSTLAAINALTKQKQGDLRPAYNTFCGAVTNTVEAAATTRKRVQWMSGEGQKYFTDWQTTVNSIANPSLRKKAQKRLDSVNKNFEKVAASLTVAGEKFSPFLSDLNDIKTSLAADVTAGGAKAIRGTVRSANWDHQFVNDAINDALKGMDKMQKALSSEAN